mmetsp:Transcript_20452/g.28236  ORF Transcript_20452/g.28236 Transcript_20452/m.28236 type:complete len:225 (-) Transcript_20452:53-727(-)|eukprot:CAMPEP_0201481768 /NCGR_PEP_ID=MMETSP0151_2-20130828/6028_1 /ASSEMBLY_ACC=CAM_ASM_000257 /TAXON_ID=200890 /ORGANISM="Paramoeba atlantica, Strain 621/1 / CCAP 1560/9" /LENGTH=224 /DNA_ID=CAMNT_0047864123 /DNA_START=31 /DNA_END=705 /DNA_ORIENTATION=+
MFGLRSSVSLSRTLFSSQSRSIFTQPPLQYDVAKGLAPIITPLALDLHYNKHHATYVANANRLVEGTKFEGKDLVTVVRESYGDSAPIFNNTAQIWNHSFFFDCMAPVGETGGPSEGLLKEINLHFETLEKFQTKFSEHAKGLFGSGWTWLVDNDGHLEIMNTSNAGTPLTNPKNLVPLLALDVWEHSYYVDYHNRRPEYIENWWKIVNWTFVSEQLAQARAKK